MGERRFFPKEKGGVKREDLKKSVDKNKMHIYGNSVLEKVPLIILDQDTSTRRYVQRFLEQRKVFVHPEFELATSDIIVQFALRNLGVGSVVRDFAKKELDSRELIELKLEEQLPQREFFVVTEEKGGSSLAAQELLRMLSETAEENEGGDRI